MSVVTGRVVEIRGDVVCLRFGQTEKDYPVRPGQMIAPGDLIAIFDGEVEIVAPAPIVENTPVPSPGNFDPRAGTWVGPQQDHS